MFSDGNYGRAVAWASKLANRKSVVFVPEGTVASRIRAIENEGASVIQVSANYDETCAVAEAASISEGWQLVQDSSWENYREIPALIMAGYLTHFREMENSLHSPDEPTIDLVFLHSGVGSWPASAVWYYLYRYKNKRPKIVIVEPAGSDGMLSSFKANKRVKPDSGFGTIMAGLNCGIPSLSAWEIIKVGADAAMKVGDEFARQAIRELYYPMGNDERIIAGESGAGGLAGFLALMTTQEMSGLKEELGITPQTNILFYNTEGATDPDNFNRIIDAPGNQW